MALVSLKCSHCGGDIELDDSREFGFCMYCGSKVMITRDVNNINVQMSVKEQRESLKPLALVYCQKGEYDRALEMTSKLILINAADADIWRVDGACKLMKSGYPFDPAPESALSSLENAAILSGTKFDKASVEEIAVGLLRGLADKDP